jgi:hypothetical protein
MTRLFVCLVVAVLMLVARPAQAQERDSLVNGALIGGAIGVGSGIAFVHALRDGNLAWTGYRRGAIIFGAIGAGIGIGIDALIYPRTPRTASRLIVAPALSHDTRGAVVTWRW